MRRLFFLLFASFLYPAEVAMALDSDRDHTAIVDAQDIEIDFAKGQWTYRGDVTITQGTLRMKADEILLFFDGDVLQRAIAHGQPAVFRQQPEGSDYLIRGQAQTIEIDEIDNVAIFSGNAKLQQHRDTITGETIIYHIETEKMTVRGNVAIPGQTTRLSTSDTTEDTTSSASVSSARPKIVIQPQASTTPEQSANSFSEPSVLSTAINADSESTEKSGNSEGDANKELESSGNSLQFHAARIIAAGTAAYSEPGAEAALLGGLSGSMPVKLFEARNDWARITIPSGINVWVFAPYIVRDRNGQARVQGSGVRARWLPSTDSRIVGVLAPDEKVRVIATQNQWKQISLPTSIATWVPLSQLETLEDTNAAWLNDWQSQIGVRPAAEN